MGHQLILFNKVKSGNRWGYRFFDGRDRMIATGMREAPRINYYYAKINYNTMYSRASSMKNGTIADMKLGMRSGLHIQMAL